MSVSLKGFDEKIITLKVTDGVKAGDAVSVYDDNEVTVASEGVEVFGIALSVMDGYAAIQVGGYTVLPCADVSEVTVGYHGITGTGDGTVTVGENGRHVFILNVNKNEGTIGVIL